MPLLNQVESYRRGVVLKLLTYYYGLYRYRIRHHQPPHGHMTGEKRASCILACTKYSYSLSTTIKEVPIRTALAFTGA